MEAGGLSQEAPVYATTLILVRQTGVLATLTVVLAVRLDTCLMATAMSVPVLTPCTSTHRVLTQVARTVLAPSPGTGHHTGTWLQKAMA